MPSDNMSGVPQPQKDPELAKLIEEAVTAMIALRHVGTMTEPALEEKAAN